MKSLLLPLALCAALTGCATYVPYDPNAYPYGAPTGVVQPAAVYTYPYPHSYGYAYPYYGTYWYPSIWISGSYWSGGHRHGHRWHGHGHRRHWRR
jgi:hypothetical protein